ncbi:MAG: hypothetical protein KAS70_00430 [Planctomycetes bacterium]|nr:hypothetical protein [Planctomycetota bacterium]MCK5578527.1 hypothetical protein [Planctomycetota bacterium]
MLKKMFLLASLLGIGLMGCIGYNQEWDPSWTDDFAHEKRHFRAFWQDLASIHRFIDRHLFNFDETDPGRY